MSFAEKKLPRGDYSSQLYTYHSALFSQKRPAADSINKDIGRIDQEDLCHHCATIDFDTPRIKYIVSHPVKLSERFLCGFANSGASTEELSQSQCRFCRFFAECEEKSKKQCIWVPDSVLRVFPAHRVLGMGPKSDNFALHVQGTKTWILPCPKSQHNDTRSPYARILKGHVDFDVVRHWLSFCKENHGDKCGKTTIPCIPGLQLVDCMTRKIVDAPENCEFAALSYLWGPASSDSPNKHYRQLPMPASLVIEDAIAVTRKLDIRFLWIDRYCIDQSCAETKHDQIRNMNNIYSGAAITLIDATGKNPDCGLPGVSIAPRDLPPSVQINGYTLVYIPNVKWEVKNSPWSGRGWTYQEGLLSRRRLVFTKSQAYFQCLGMHCCETIAAPLEAIHVEDSYKYEDSNRDLRVFPVRALGKSTTEVFSRLAEYLSRQLSYDSDILNAFLGVFEAFQKFDPPVYHFWGLPIFKDTVHLHWGIRTSYKDSQTEGVSLSAEESFLSSLLWTMTNLFYTRRQPFPSWTWAAWKPADGGFSVREFTFNDPPAVRLRSKSGRLVTIEEYTTAVASGSNYLQYEPCIYLTGWVTEVRFGAGYGYRPVVTYPVPGGCLIDLLIDRTSEGSTLRRLRQTSWDIIIVQAPSFASEGEAGASSMKALLLQPEVNGSYSRLSTLQWHRIRFRSCNDGIFEVEHSDNPNHVLIIHKMECHKREIRLV